MTSNNIDGTLVDMKNQYDLGEIRKCIESAIYKTAEVKQITQNFWSQNDVLITPTVGALFTKRICESDPLGPNFQNGTYTNFANLLGLNGLAIPFGKSSENVPWGLTLYSQPNQVNSAVQLAKDIACFVKS